MTMADSPGMKSNISSLIIKGGDDGDSPGTNSTLDEDWHPASDRGNAGLSRREKCLTEQESLPHHPVLDPNEEEPDDLDDQFYCEECQSFYLEECEIHGPPSFTYDSPIPLGVPQRALLTLPPGMVIGRSSIPGAGLGVFNQGKLVPVGMHFGPFEGEVTSKEKAIESSYSWVICKKKNQYEFIDAARDSHSNWMRYVSCARSEDEQNLVAFQHRGRVLYRCVRLIPQGQELLVWYADEYAKELGAIWDSLWNKKCSAADVYTEEPPKSFPCIQCQFSFTAEVYLHKHIKRSHPAEFLRLQESGSICSQCGRIFNDLESLKEHQCAEAEERPHSCTECGRTFARLCHLKRHERTIHIKEKPYCCSQCGKCFSQSAGLKRHQQIHTGGKRKHRRVDVMSEVFACSHCTFSFTSELLLHKHIKRHHPEKHCKQVTSESKGAETDAEKQLPSSCTPPSPNRATSGTPPAHGNGRKRKTFKHRRASAWTKRQKVARQFRCSQCGKGFGDAETLKGHQCETEEGPFHCLECGRSFTRSCNLKRHERSIHTKEKPYCCSLCGKCFSQSAGLKRHQQTHADGRRHHQGVDMSNQVFSCSYCTFSFTAERYLYKHRKRYHPLEHLLRTGSVRVAQTGDGPNFCSQCGKSFSCLKSLKAHHCMRVGEKLYLCTDCGKSFSWFYGLKQHQRIHTGEKPFVCTQCGKRFVHSGQLNVHMRTHTGEKPFLCTVCGESFRQSGDLKRHERKHTGVRPCRCDECGKSFSRPQSLKAHQQLHTGEKLYHCPVCGKSFARSWHLRRHNQKMHSS